MSLRKILIGAAIAGTAFAAVPAPAGEELKIDAGANQTGRVGAAVSVSGSVSKAAAIGWSKEQGPGDVVFEKRNSPATKAFFDQPGEYTLMLAGFDGYVVYDTVRITITE